MPMTRPLKRILMRISTSFRILVLSGLICSAPLAFYVTFYPAKAQEKQLPSNQHKLRTFTLANHTKLQLHDNTNYFNSVKQVPVQVSTYHVNSNATVSSKGSSLPCVQTRTIPSFTICVFPTKEDIYISGSIQETGTWDTLQTVLIQESLNTFPNALFIDVGANIGYYSLLARAMGRTVIAIEPTDETFLRLQEGVVRNKFYDKMFMLKYAISDTRTRVVMGDDKRNKGGISIAREVNGPANISRSVEAITLDDLVNLIPAKEIIIKMDIEGYECKALQSSKQLLRSFKVRYIFMEWIILPHNNDLRDTPCHKANILHMLANMYSMGFTPYSVHGGELDISNSRSWNTNDIYWKPQDSPTLNDVHKFDRLKH